MVAIAADRHLTLAVATRDDPSHTLMLALNDHNVLPEKEIVNVLKDAAAAHENADQGNGDAKLNAAVVVMINKILAGGNSVRRP